MPSLVLSPVLTAARGKCDMGVDHSGLLASSINRNDERPDEKFRPECVHKLHCGDVGCLRETEGQRRGRACLLQASGQGSSQP